MSAMPPSLSDLPALALPVTVVGDVHLSAKDPEVTARFLAFLRGLEGRGGTLVLLGDVFDWWVGDGQEQEPAVVPISEALARVERSGVRVCFQGGNRDFFLTGLPGLTLEIWPDVVRTTCGGRRVLFTHGDLLVSGDPGYQRLRRVLRSAGSRWLMRVLPYGARIRIARLLRRSSRRALATKAQRQVDIDYGLARAWLESTETEVLVAGHVHTGVHHRLGGPPPREVLVLKDWDRRGGVVRLDGERVWLASA